MSHWHDLFLNTLASRKWSWWPLVSHHSSKKAATVNPAWLPITLVCGALYHKGQFEFHCRTVRHWDKLTASRQRCRSSHRVANDILQNQCSVKAAITSVYQEEILMGILMLLPAASRAFCLWWHICCLGCQGLHGTSSRDPKAFHCPAEWIVQAAEFPHETSLSYRTDTSPLQVAGTVVISKFKFRFSREWKKKLPAFNINSFLYFSLFLMKYSVIVTQNHHAFYFNNWECKFVINENKG